MIIRILFFACLISALVCACSESAHDDANPSQAQSPSESPQPDRSASSDKFAPESNLSEMGMLIGIPRQLTAHHNGAKGTLNLTFRDSSLSDGAGSSMQLSQGDFDRLMEYVESKGESVPVLSPRQISDGLGSLPRVVYYFAAKRPNSIVVVCEGEYKSE